MTICLSKKVYGSRIVETVLYIVLYIIAFAAICARLAFTFPDKASKPAFWVINAVAAVVVGMVIYLIVSIC